MPIACFIFLLVTVNVFFQFLSCSIRMYIPIAKNSHILLKEVLLKLAFQDEGYFYVSCLFHILTV